jgi:flagellar assembly protein FliH
MSEDIPKEQQTAYQRWEMVSFGDDRPSVLEEKVAQQAELTLKQLLEVEAIKKAAHIAGHAEGFIKGKQDGLTAGNSIIEEEIERLRKIAIKFEATVEDIEARAAQDILELALDIARAMLKTALVIQPNIVLSVIKTALHTLPILQNPTITVHPGDAPHIREGLAKMSILKSTWEVLEDETIERGGCKVDTVSNQIDLTLQKRWQQINNALRQDTDWLPNVSE